MSIATFTGCSVLCPKQPPTYAVTPIPAPPVLARPSLKINEIVQDTPDGVVVQYWRATVEQLISYSKQLEDIVESYRQMSKENKN